jgi:hypothetical protein
MDADLLAEAGYPPERIATIAVTGSLVDALEALDIIGTVTDGLDAARLAQVSKSVTRARGHLMEALRRFDGWYIGTDDEHRNLEEG